MNWYHADTAPKDGTRVLFFVPAWDEPDARPEDGALVSGRFDAVLEDFLADSGESIAPTHWTFLPRLPAKGD